MTSGFFLLERRVFRLYHRGMDDKTIIKSSAIGKRLDGINKSERSSYIMFDRQRIPLASKITIGRAGDNSIVVDSMLASRYHALIQQIKGDYFIKDLDSTNGTLVNGEPLEKDKYRKLESGDVIAIGKAALHFQ